MAKVGIVMCAAFASGHSMIHQEKAFDCSSYTYQDTDNALGTTTYCGNKKGHCYFDWERDGDGEEMVKAKASSKVGCPRS